MKITHDGNVRITRKRKSLIEAAKFYAKYLKLEDYKDVTVCLCFKYGYTELFQTYAQVEHIAQNLLNIEIDAHIHDNIGLHILAHEMVHVKQYVTGKLAEDSEGMQLWRGKYVQDALEYIDEPWEREAMKKQIIMQYAYVAYRETLNE